MNISFWLGSKEYRLHLVQKKKNDMLVTLGKNTHEVSVEFLSSEEILLNIDGKIHDVIVNANMTAYTIYVNGKRFRIEKRSALQILGPKTTNQRQAKVKTSMPGRIVDVLVTEGDEVEEGQAVLILEAMKMQNEIKSPQRGHISSIYPKAGESVETGALLFTVD